MIFGKEIVKIKELASFFYEFNLKNEKKMPAMINLER